ncbi:hypothetical protein ACFWPA_09745 [Rhodococcus sp. NPDC058505]|uniref:hypothetical protein n=1 Tax=unclassified Rhodococcus (in: high G+C Gram-positive bacteria) TaxID=192944 RepID=UPI0036539AA4
MILVVRRPIVSGFVEDAIAISFIAGRNATFYVRGDVSTEHWTSVLAGWKISARLKGARRLKFVANSLWDEYDAMYEKLSFLHSCDAAGFAAHHKQLRFNEHGDYEMV